MGYSSSSDDEEDEESNADTTKGAGDNLSKRGENDAAVAATGCGGAGDSFPVRKKIKTEKQLPKTR